MKKRIKDNYEIIVSAILAGAFFLFVCFYYKIFPFGTEYCLLSSDLAHQYCPMLIKLYDILKSEEGLLYSWNAGLGYSFIGNYFNYLASPFNLIILLFSRENVVHAVNIIILLKTVLTAGCFSYYLKKTYYFNNASNIIPSLLYAFSGWFVAYYWNIMWLDAVYCLPIAVLGLHRITDSKKPWCYLAVLTYAMLTNYYTAYMLCIFMCIYFVYLYLVKNDVRKDLSQGLFKSNLFKSGLVFAGSSVLSAAIAAAVLIPTFFQLRATSAVTDSFSVSPKLYFNFLDFLVQQFSGSYAIVQTSGQPDIPNCWTGMLTVILIPVYLFSKQFEKKERILDILLLSFMFFSLNLNLLSYIWCGFHFANGMADRFAFFYVFVAVSIMSKALCRIDQLKRPLVIIAAVSALVFITAMRFLAPERTEKYTFLIGVGFTLVWLILYMLFQIKKLDRTAIRIFAVFAVCLELAFAQLENFDFNYSKDNFDRYSAEFQEVYSNLPEIDSELFFRTEAISTQGYLYPFTVGYNGVSNSSSMASYNTTRSQYALGIDSNSINNLIYYPSTPIYNTLFGVKYLIGSSKYVDKNLYNSECLNIDGFCAFKNEYYLPIAYCVNSEAESFASKTDGNPFLVQNELFTLMSGAPPVFADCELCDINTDNVTVYDEQIDLSTGYNRRFVRRIDAEEDGYIEYKYVAQCDGEYYVYISHERKTKGTEIIVSDNVYSYTKEVSSFYTEPKAIMSIGKHNRDETICIRIPVSDKFEEKGISVYVASFDSDAFSEGYNALKDTAMKLTEFSDCHLSGVVTAQKDCLLFTSIPYDNGWRITLDGNKLTKEDLLAFDNAYISLNLSCGEHVIEFDYFPTGLKVGILISVLSVIGTVLLFVADRKKSDKCKADK